MITGSGETSYVHLGRPWGPFARVVFAYTHMDVCIKPAGWDNWGKAENERTACFYEYKYVVFNAFFHLIDNDYTMNEHEHHRVIKHWSPDRRRVFSGTGVSGQGVAQWKGCVGQENYWMKKLMSSFCIDLSIPTWIGLGYARGWHWGFLFLLKNMGSCLKVSKQKSAAEK